MYILNQIKNKSGIKVVSLMLPQVVSKMIPYYYIKYISLVPIEKYLIFKIKNTSCKHQMFLINFYCVLLHCTNSTGHTLCFTFQNFFGALAPLIVQSPPYKIYINYGINK